ncbi:radical SAM protein [bacterium]|nr:radical SAM protein [bacterium]
MNKYKYIYGPVFSWRLGRSLGIDPLSQAEKVCTYDCLYCQVGRASEFKCKRSVFVSTREIMEEIKKLPPVGIDYITFSGRGEPTLALNLGEMIRAVKDVRKEKIAVITNSSLLNEKEVREDLALADLVMAKLDAGTSGSFQSINNPSPDIKFEDMLLGIKKFRRGYKGKFALQIMFVEKNKNEAIELANLCREIKPAEIQINTPLRPSGVSPLSKEELKEIIGCFNNIDGVKVISVYDVEKKKVIPFTKEDTCKRRGKELNK